MPVFEINTPIKTEEPVIIVSANEKPLAPGRYRFRLVVVDNDGLESDPSEVDIVVRDNRRPTAILDAPNEVLFGQEFRLDGRRSSDLDPGKIVNYVWTLVG